MPDLLILVPTIRTFQDDSEDSAGGGPPKPTAPSLLTAVPDATVPKVTLNWTQGTGTISSVKLYRQVNGGGFSLYQTLGVVVTYVDNGVAVGNTYDYKVLDHGPGGDSGFSNVATAIVAIDPTTFATPAGWWKADSFSLPDGTVVGSPGNEWVDQMGNSNHYGRMGTAALRPAFKTNIFGSMPSIFFDEKDDNTIQNALEINNGNTANSITTAGDWTIIAVYKAEANVAGRGWGTVLCGNAYANGTMIGIQGTNTNVGQLSMRAENPFGGSVSTALATGFDAAMMGVWRVSATNIQFRENKTNRSPAASPFGTLKVSTIGVCAGGAPVTLLRAHIGEIVIYLSALTNAQLDSLYDNYFKPRWGLP